MKRHQKHVLHSPRLALRPLEVGHTGDLHKLWTAPGVRRFLWDDRTIPYEETFEVIRTSAQFFSKQGFGLWGAWEADNQQLVGFGGFWHFRNAQELEILYGVAELAWNKGYATEIAGAVVRYALEELHFSEVRGSTDAANLASVRVMEKLGFRLDPRETVQGLDTLFFVLETTAP